MDKVPRKKKQPKLFKYEEQFNPEFDFSKKYCNVKIDINFDKIGANWKALNGDQEELSKLLSAKRNSEPAILYKNKGVINSDQPIKIEEPPMDDADGLQPEETSQEIQQDHTIDQQSSQLSQFGNFMIPNIIVTPEEDEMQDIRKNRDMITQQQIRNHTKLMKNINSDSSITFLDQQMVQSDAKMFYDQHHSN